MDLYILLISFFIIAMIYSSVGFGGGSSYLALLALPLFALDFPIIRSTALFCNIVVVVGGTVIFYREGKVVWKEMWPYLASSIPMAYVGGFWPIKQETFFILLGITLVIVPFLLWFQPEGERRNGVARLPETTGLKILIGSAIGLLSGLVGIGGGIFLSPFLHILRWSEPRKISALASVFILVNSLGGLAGQFNQGIPEWSVGFLAPLLLAVFLGGQMGSRWGARKFSPIRIRRITAVLILVAGINILINHI